MDTEYTGYLQKVFFLKTKVSHLRNGQWGLEPTKCSCCCTGFVQGSRSQKGRFPFLPSRSFLHIKNSAEGRLGCALHGSAPHCNRGVQACLDTSHLAVPAAWGGWAQQDGAGGNVGALPEMPSNTMAGPPHLGPETPSHQLCFYFCYPESVSIVYNILPPNCPASGQSRASLTCFWHVLWGSWSSLLACSLQGSGRFLPASHDLLCTCHIHLLYSNLL